MTNPTIPTLESIIDLTAITEWQVLVTEQTDVSLLPSDVYMYGSGLYFCVVFEGKLEAKNLPAGSCYRIFAELCAKAAGVTPFSGEYTYFSELESEE